MSTETTDRYHPEHQDYRRWRGPFRAEAFSLVAVNRNLWKDKPIPDSQVDANFE